MYEQTGWTQAAVGCHWTRGPFHVSTTQRGDGSDKGYTISNAHGSHIVRSWDEVERLCDRRKHDRRAVDRNRA